MKPLVINNAKILLDSYGLNPNPDNTLSSLLILDGKIAQLGTRLSLPADCEIFDAGGMILTPGWIDIQLNGVFGLDFTENPDSIWQAASELPGLGTTSFLPTIITSPLETMEHAIAINKNGPPSGFKGAHVIGLHLEGPFLNAGKKGAHNPRYLQKPSPGLVQNWSRSNGVFLVTIAPELDDGFATIRRLRDQGVIVSAGHSLATYEQARQAFQNGVRCGTHLFNAQSAIEHRNPGLSIAILDDPDIYAGLIVDGIHLHPGMVKMAWTCKGNRRFITVTDAISALGMPPGKYKLGDFEIIVTDTTVTLPDGTLAGSNITQQRSLRNLMAWTGCSLYEAVRTMTATPAELFNLSNKGRIAIGADADLVLVDENINIKATVVGGEILFRGS